MDRKNKNFDLWLGTAVLVLMVFVVVLQVVFRYFGHPLSWPEEVARWTMIWVTFAAASYAFKNGGLIRVEFFVQKFFSPKSQKIINIVDMSLLGILFLYLLYSSILYILLTLKKSQVYNVTRMPYAVVVAALTLSGILCMIFSFRQIMQLLKPGNTVKDNSKEGKK